jgi:ribonuclease P protein component
MSKNTFCKYEKIRRKKEFLTIYREGSRRYSDDFIIFTYKHISGNRRLGITVSKKTGNAVRRNRIKRLIREYFRLNKLQLSESQDIVIVGKKNIPRLNYHDVCKELKCLVIDKEKQ